MRFKKSELVKECLLADMEGEPLPIGPTLPATKNPWKRQKVSGTLCHTRNKLLIVFHIPPQEFGFSRSLFGRFGRNRAVPPSPPMQQAQSKTKKDSKSMCTHTTKLCTHPPQSPLRVRAYVERKKDDAV